ncbi:hypothetical protein OG352_33750 [Streptomyces sp. NBC_01485]|uniref:hypothetical protein n=1 Tax=Streptomyces sp. NBC_01485 TaxID=2903884 RepID=UPI002E35A578|nr:hypothetical protein [Streptomyces sp. NBC_01485]
MNWRQIPLADLPSVFFGLTAGSLVTAKDGFLFAGRLPGGGSEMYRSADGIHWRASQPSAGNMSVRALAAYDGEVVAGGKVLRDGEDSPAVIRYRGEGRWSAVQYLPGGKPSDVVLAAARGPRGSVVVGHDGGPFEPDTERKRGRSLRVWVSTGTDPFGAPHEVTCPQWPDQEPEVGALADEHGFTVWARCADPWGTSKSLVIDSSDGADWHTAVGPRTSLPLNAAVSGPSGSVVLTGPLTSAAATAKSPEAWSRKASADGSGWRRTGSLGGTEGERRLIGDVVAVPGGYVAAGSAETTAGVTGAVWSSADGRHWNRQTGGEDGFRQSVRVDAVAEYKGTFLAFGTDPATDGHPPSNTRVWLGTSPGHTPKPLPTKGTGLRAVAGDWGWAQGSLKISEQGEFAYRFRIFRDCATDGPPCDDVDTSTWGGVVTGTVTEGSGGGFQGRVISSNAPDRPYKPGTAVAVTREPYSAVGLTIGKSVVGVFCAPGAFDERCLDVQG